MSGFKKYKIYCATENKDKTVLASTPPTTCPADNTHTVRLKSVAVMESNPNGDILEVLETSEPATPNPGKNIIYFDINNGLLSTKDDQGTVRKYYGSKQNVIYVSALGESDFTNIKDAVDAANAMLPGVSSAVLVQPGTYIENNPIIVGSGVSLVSVGGAMNTTIVPSDPTKRLLVPDGVSSIRGFTLYGVTSNAAVYYDGSQGSATLNESLIANCDTGVHIVNGPGIYFVSEVAARCLSFPTTTTVNTGVLVESGGFAILSDIGLLGQDGNKMDIGIKSTGKNADTSAPSTILAMGGTMEYCSRSCVVDNGARLENYMMRISNSDKAIQVGNLGTDSSIMINNTSIYDSSVYDLEILSTDGNICAMATNMDQQKISNPHDVNLKTFTFDSDGTQHIYSNIVVHGNFDISNGSLTGLRSGLNIDMNATTSETDYVTFNRIRFPGTIRSGIPGDIKFIAKQDPSVADYSLRIIDQTHSGNLICELNGLNNNDDQIITCTDFGNLSPTECIWYVQGKVNGGTGNIYVYNTQINRN